MAIRLRDNVRRGAKLLDSLAPGRWYSPRKISLAKLDMEDTCNCISGQLRQTDPVLQDRFIEAAGGDEDYDRDEFPLRYGCDTAGWTERYDILQDEWEKQIRARRQADRV